MNFIEWLLGLAILTTFIYLHYIRPLKYWQKKGVKGPKPLESFDNLFKTVVVKTSINKITKDAYAAFANEKFVGIYTENTPGLIVRDVDLIKDILIKDFSNFSDRGLYFSEKVDPLSAHLFFIEPRRWRPLRHKLSPVFTSGKLREMFYIIKGCSEKFDEFLRKIVDEGNQVMDVRELSAKYTTDVIGATAFGLDMNALSEEDSDFRKMGKNVFKRDVFGLIKLRIRDFFPRLYDILKPVFYNKELNNFFINNIRQTIEYREKENITRHDFIDILRELKKNPKLSDDFEFTDSLLTAQAFVFFLAGFETSSTTIANTLYELALNQEIQNKLREEVLEVFEKSDINYENLKNMSYMHSVIQETLRKYPVVPTLTRKSTSPYTFSGTNLTIPEGMKIFIPVMGIQSDPNIYPDPDKFDPERFEDSIAKKRHPMHHIPFGDGPRNCIGLRFAYLQVKLGLLQVLRNFRFDVCEKTMIPYELDMSTFLLAPKRGIFLKITKLNGVL